MYNIPTCENTTGVFDNLPDKKVARGINAAFFRLIPIISGITT